MKNKELSISKILNEAYGKNYKNENPKADKLFKDYFIYIINDLKKHSLDEKDSTLVLSRLYYALKGYLNSGSIKNWKNYN